MPKPLDKEENRGGKREGCGRPSLGRVDATYRLDPKVKAGICTAATLKGDPYPSDWLNREIEIILEELGIL